VSRPHVSVVMPFAGDAAAARTAIDSLLSLHTEPGDQLILADNSGVVPAAPGIVVVAVTGERSPAHARNVGAERAHSEWILFLDADCRAPADLLDSYFSAPIADDVGALAGEVRPAPAAGTTASRYGAARNFLSQEAHLAHPYRPRAVAANLLVRGTAFEQVGGFYEGLRAAEDTDFSWRVQQAGWRLELRPDACVEHNYRTTVGELRRQWRGYAAGRAWLARRYPGFEPEPAIRRAGARAWRRLPSLRGLSSSRRAAPNPAPAPAGAPSDGDAPAGRVEHLRFRALDALLAIDELAGMALSNRPSVDAHGRVDAVLVADRFPGPGDPLVELALAFTAARVEAAARPQALDFDAVRELRIDYREDDGAAARALALVKLSVRHPVRCALDLLRREQGVPGLAELAPAVRRLERDGSARVHVLGYGGARVTAERLARLAGRELEG
jgi:Glycosyl transferase family group 2